MGTGWAIILSILLSVLGLSVHAQNLEACGELLDQIGDFEGQRDPKCAATANRLEDFMYGTPLLEEARIRKAELQKELIIRLWKKASVLSSETGPINAVDVNNATASLKPLKEETDRFSTEFENEEVFVSKRDLKHYSSVAYAYRALLAVQQEMLFQSEMKLKPLSAEASEEIKNYVDQLTLMALKLSDIAARHHNEHSISAARFEEAFIGLTNRSEETHSGTNKLLSQQEQADQLQLVKHLIAKKQEAFQEYNQINMFLFQRNAQVYFSRHGWPKDDAENERFRMIYNEALIQFVKDIWMTAEQAARMKGSPLIRLEDVSAALETYLPFTANELEDITFFPKLDRALQVDVEAYDLDAFRDGGVHWTYIQLALSDSGFQPGAVPDPFALELLSEGVAHLGVLSLRMAGEFSKKIGHDRLTVGDLIEGFRIIQERITLSGTASEKTSTANTSISSSSQLGSTGSGTAAFTDVTGKMGITFEHRSADWLSRLIRSYAVDTIENVIKTAIPPAFGGGGIAAEDINNDGYADLLILSGTGNRLLINNGKGEFTDKTEISGINWSRADRTFGEPRQPIIADFNNDGTQDVFISYVNDQHRIYQNSGDLKFEDRTSTAKFGGAGSVGGPCTAFDFDNDGLLDIYIGYFGDYLNGIHPTLARKNKNGLKNKLFRNLGDFRFEEVLNAGVDDNGWSQSIGHADINGDQLQDLIVGNDFGTNTYYLNNGDGTFTDATRDLGTDKPSFTMNVGITDLNQDHLPDFYISNIVVMEKDEKYVSPSAESEMKFNRDVMANMRVVEANDLFISSSENETVNYALSTDISRGYSATGWSWDADFFDYDNDGDQDLYCLTGMNDFMVYSTENPYYQDPEGNDRNIRMAESHRESNIFFINQGGKLVAASGSSGLEEEFNSRSATYLDWDLDGDEDMVINNYHDAAKAYQNNSEKLENNWIKIRLNGDPEKKVNLDAIGAKIIVTADGLDVWREVHSTTGYLSVHPKEQHIGVGSNLSVSVRVEWPNGDIQEFEEVKANGRYELKMGLDLNQK